VSPDHLEFLAEIASLYYEESLSQSEIASRTGYSRSMVSRFLTEARQEGLVEIKVHHPISRRLDLERELQHNMCLGQARVVLSGELRDTQLLRRLELWSDCR
jgi:DNA-binding transcriptional regulator LsrR (DeoR family)